MPPIYLPTLFAASPSTSHPTPSALEDLISQPVPLTASSALLTLPWDWRWRAFNLQLEDLLATGFLRAPVVQ